jgi:hypothetical protein
MLATPGLFYVVQRELVIVSKYVKRCFIYSLRKIPVYPIQSTLLHQRKHTYTNIHSHTHIHTQYPVLHVCLFTVFFRQGLTRLSSLEFSIFPPSCPECWDYRCNPIISSVLCLLYLELRCSSLIHLRPVSSLLECMLSHIDFELTSALLQKFLSECRMHSEMHKKKNLQLNEFHK